MLYTYVDSFTVDELIANLKMEAPDLDEFINCILMPKVFHLRF